jgi:hypothetical protein
MNRRPVLFQQCNGEVAHQRMAGIASWMAFSARWRARQGLPLLHPMDVQYLTPQDFCNGLGQPLPPTEQRRLFRAYVEAALQVSPSSLLPVKGRRRLPESGDLAFVRAAGFVRTLRVRQDVVYGRQDIREYEPDALSPARPYGVPTTSEQFQRYWMDGVDLVEDEDE